MSQASLFKETPETPESSDSVSRINVLVPYPVAQAYTYAVPEGLAVQPGDYVTVPLGKREIPGVVWDGAPDDHIPAAKLKSVVMRYDLPPMPPEHRAFIDWLAQYNMAGKGMVLKMSLSVPGALEEPKAATGYVLSGWVREIFEEMENAPSPVSRCSPPSPPRGGGWGEGGETLYKEKPSAQMIVQARSLRKNQTEAEKKLWFSINNRQLLGFKFKRQHPIPPYVADFACAERKLVIELDGGQHDERQEYDRERTKFLNAQGWRALRFWNNEVMENIEGVLQVIADALKTPSPDFTAFNHPLPCGEREGVRGKKSKFLQNLSPQRQKIIRAMTDGVPRRAAEIAELTGCTPAIVKGLVKLDILKEVPLHSAAPCRKPDMSRSGPALSDAQRDAAQELCAFVEQGGFHAALLDGVTGAGKTETYFEAVAAAIKQDRQVLILLPEIALSNAFLDRFRARFGCAPALWHSSLSPGQRKATWRGVAQGDTKVVVGARSALMLPYKNPGLIVVDEEHDSAYKQEDGVIYNARDMAVMRAHLGKIPVVLVSATPSLETMANCWAGKYAHLHLPDRHGGASLPDVHVVDMRADKPPDRRHFLSPPIIEAVTKTLEAGEQALMFLNRRGYAPLTLCRSCGHRMECPRCTAWLVEHKRTGRLQCHHCGYNTPFPKTCPSCADTDSLAPCGPGVERVKEEIKEYFPEARTIVLASDTAQTHDELTAILSAIRNHEYDIIIGTQIIAKGHHFPMLTCVGIIDADLGLKGGDLRAAEKTYQLLHQVAGRAGREDRPGHVYLQTFFPDHKVMQALAADERDLFYEIEAQERESAHMPPYSRLAGIIVSGKNEQQVTDTAQELGKTAPHGDALQTFGPVEAPFYRLRGNYRRRLLVRADKNINLQKAIGEWMGRVKIPSTVRVHIDIDPQNFL